MTGIDIIDEIKKCKEKEEREISKEAELLYKLFVNRNDVFAEGWLDGKRMAYAKKDEPLILRVVNEHFLGERTIGVYQLWQGIVKWGVFDFDENTQTDFDKAKILYNFLKNKGYHPLMEKSGGGEFKVHIWIFANTDATSMRYFMQNICNECQIKAHEIFPKQDSVSNDGYGNLVKLPLALHLASGARSHFLDDEFKIEGDIKNVLNYHLQNPDKIERVIVKEKTIIINDNKEKVEHCAFLDFCITHPLPEGGRHDTISRNVAFYIHDKDNFQTLKESYIKTQKKPATDLDGWLKGIEKGKATPICCGELVNYQKEFKLGIKCKGCKYFAKYMNDKKTETVLQKNIEKLEVEMKEMKEEKKELKMKDEERKELVLPGLGKLISIFARQVSEILKDKNTIFYRMDAKDIVEIGKIKLHKNGEEIYTGFVEVKPNRFITLAEKYIIPGINIWDDRSKEWEFKDKSMGADLANTILCSEILHNHLPKINRIFTIPLPILYNEELTFPKRGYDERFYSWMPHNAPEIIKPDMPLEEAKEIIKNLFSEFCFKSDQDFTNAVSALLTPFCRGLFTSFHTRTPAFFYTANRERAGKDYLAGITGIVYEGYAMEESPVSSSENAKSNHTEELRKKILAAMISGRKRLHFSNNKGFINNAVFEAIITAEKYSDRLLGRNEILTFENELDFSLSGNTGIGFTPDFANRCRFIRLFLDIEDANSRKFTNPNLHHWVKENRSMIVSALFSIVKNWIDKGKPKGSVIFTSFPQWAEIIGGIMETAGYGNPCAPDREVICLGGDNETNDMKQLFELCYEKHPEQWIKKYEIKQVVIEDGHIFGYLDFDKRPDQISFGNKIIKFTGRVFSDIRLIIKDEKVRPARQEFMFTKEQSSHNDKKTDVKTNKDEINGEMLVICGNLGNRRPQFVENGKSIDKGVVTNYHYYRDYQTSSSTGNVGEINVETEKVETDSKQSLLRKDEEKSEGL